VSTGPRIAAHGGRARHRASRSRTGRWHVAIGRFHAVLPPTTRVGIDSHCEPVLGDVTDLTHQCLDRGVDPAAASGSGIPPPTRRICRLVRPLL
jgi:hypothetical protein